MIKNKQSRTGKVNKSTGNTQNISGSNLLNNSIIDNIYRVEKRRTTETVIRYVIIVSILSIFIFLLGANIYNILSEQKTWDLLEIFREDREIISTYLPEVTQTFVAEMPPELTVIFFVIIILFLASIVLIIRNFPKIKNRIKSIKNYFTN